MVTREKTYSPRFMTSMRPSCVNARSIGFANPLPVGELLVIPMVLT